MSEGVSQQATNLVRVPDALIRAVFRIGVHRENRVSDGTRDDQSCSEFKLRRSQVRLVAPKAEVRIRHAMSSECPFDGDVQSLHPIGDGQVDSASQSELLFREFQSADVFRACIHELLRVIATPELQAIILIARWRTRQDSNLRPSPSEGDTLSS